VNASKATDAIMALGLMACVLFTGCGSQPVTPATAAQTTPAAAVPTSSASAGQPSQTCVPGKTQPTARFGQLRGWITYSDGLQIWAIDPKHTASRVSLGPLNGVQSITWSPDGRQMLLLEQAGSGDATRQDLCVMHADGSLTRLTSDGHGGPASFSPDGTKVVFARWNDGLNEGLYVVGASGGTPHLIAQSYMSWWLGTPAWSRDGSRIAYTIYLEGGPEGLGYEIWTVRPDGTDPRPLVNLGHCRANCAGHLAWSPDGSMLAFHSAHSNPGPSPLLWAIYIVRADGTGLRQINESGASPAWSPGGSRLAFIGIDRNISPWRGGFYTMAADGSNLSVDNDVRADPFFGLAWNPMP
jgi:Tol biopolymer transport system component